MSVILKTTVALLSFLSVSSETVVYTAGELGGVNGPERIRGHSLQVNYGFRTDLFWDAKQKGFRFYLTVFGCDAVYTLDCSSKWYIFGTKANSKEISNTYDNNKELWKRELDDQHRYINFSKVELVKECQYCPEQPRTVMYTRQDINQGQIVPEFGTNFGMAFQTKWQLFDEARRQGYKFSVLVRRKGTTEEVGWIFGDVPAKIKAVRMYKKEEMSGVEYVETSYSKMKANANAGTHHW